MPDSFARRLRSGQALLGFGVMYPAPGIIECVGRGWDWAWIDGQHGQLDWDAILQCVRAAEAIGLASVVRVPSCEYGVVGRALDTCPSAIMAPMVDTSEQASHFVEAGRFPPLGCRSYGGRRPIDLHGRGYYQGEDAEPLLIAQIETPEAVGNAKGIAKTRGVEVLFFGPDDLKIRLGLPIDTPIEESAELLDAMRSVAEAAADSGKSAGCVAATPRAMAAALSMGYRLIVGGSDVAFLRTAAGARLAELKEVIEREC